MCDTFRLERFCMFGWLECLEKWLNKDKERNVTFSMHFDAWGERTENVSFFVLKKWTKFFTKQKQNYDKTFTLMGDGKWNANSHWTCSLMRSISSFSFSLWLSAKMVRINYSEQNFMLWNYPFCMELQLKLLTKDHRMDKQTITNERVMREK